MYRKFCRPRTQLFIVESSSFTGSTCGNAEDAEELARESTVFVGVDTGISRDSRSSRDTPFL